MKEKIVKDITGDGYLLRTPMESDPANPTFNVFGPTQFMQFDRATLEAFYKAGCELLDAQVAVIPAPASEAAA